MKKIIFLATLITAFAVVAYSSNSRKQQYAANIGPTSVVGTALTLATIAAPASNQQNCLEYATFYSSSASTIYILDGGTTNYTLTLAAAATYQTLFDEPFCATKGALLVIQSSATVAGASARVNYKGFVGQ